MLSIEVIEYEEVILLLYRFYITLMKRIFMRYRFSSHEPSCQFSGIHQRWISSAVGSQKLITSGAKYLFRDITTHSVDWK